MTIPICARLRAAQVRELEPDEGFGVDTTLGTVAADAIEELVGALEEAVSKLSILANPHLLFDVHSHYQTGELMWDTDDCGFVWSGTLTPPDYENPEDPKALLLEYYRDDLTTLAAEAVAAVGYGVGVIPVRIGRYPEDMPWEPIFSQAYMLQLGEETPEGINALVRARTLLARIKGESE